MHLQHQMYGSVLHNGRTPFIDDRHHYDRCWEHEAHSSGSNLRPCAQKHWGMENEIEPPYVPWKANDQRRVGFNPLPIRFREQDEPPLAGSYASEQSSTSTAATYGSSLLSNVSEQSSISTDTSEPPRLSSFQPPPTIHPRQHATKHSRQASVHFKRILLSKSAHRLRFGLAKPKDLQIETNLTQQGDTVFGDSRESLETICQIICIDKYGAQSRCYAKIDSGSQFDVISPEGCSQLGFKPTKYTGDDIQPFGKASKPIRPQGQIQIEWMPVNIEYIPQETYRITFLVIPMNDEDFIIGGRTAGKARLLQLGQTLDPKAKASF